MARTTGKKNIKSEINIDDIRKMVQSGLILNEISKKLGYRARSVSEFCKKNNYDVMKNYTETHKDKQYKRLKPQESGFNRIFQGYQKGAKDRGFCFELNKEEFKLLTKSNCFYCNVEPKQVIRGNKQSKHGEYIYNGIDRINNTIGYTKDNSVSCCGICNQMKMSFSFEQFISQIKKIAGRF